MSGRSSLQPSGVSTPHGRREPAVCPAQFRLYIETPRGSFYPPLLNERRLAAGKLARSAAWRRDRGLPFRLEHGEIDALGFRFGDFAYTPDLNAIPAESRRISRRPRSLDRRCAALHPASAIFSSCRNTGIGRQSRPRRAILTNLQPISISSGCDASCRRMSSRLLTACASRLEGRLGAEPVCAQRRLIRWH